MPATLLAIKYGEDPVSARDAWIAEYRKYDCPLSERLIRRAEDACRYVTERENEKKRARSGERDEAFFEDAFKIWDEENGALDGDFPLGNEEDAFFAKAHFTVPEMVMIQLGLFSELDTAAETPDETRAREGFVFEMMGETAKAVKAYEGVSGCGERWAKCLLMLMFGG